MKINRLLAGTLALVLISGFGAPAFAGGPSVLPGDMIGSTSSEDGLAGSLNGGSITLVSQLDGSQNFIGDPTGPGGGSLSGVAFDSHGNLWGINNIAPSGCDENVESVLLKINPDTGDQISSIPIIDFDTGEKLALQDLAVQPGSNVLFGSTHICDDVYTPIFDHHHLVSINPNTGIATLVGPIATIDSADFVPIGFAADGTLYAHTTDGFLLTLNPNDASTEGSIVTSGTSYSGLGVRSDGLIFTSVSGGGSIFTINPINGIETVIGPSSPDSITDLAFVPEMKVVGGELISIEATSLMLAGAQSFSWMIPVLLSGIGIGLFVVSRKSENS